MSSTKYFLSPFQEIWADPKEVSENTCDLILNILETCLGADGILVSLDYQPDHIKRLLDRCLGREGAKFPDGSVH